TTASGSLPLGRAERKDRRLKGGSAVGPLVGRHRLDAAQQLHELVGDDVLALAPVTGLQLRQKLLDVVRRVAHGGEPGRVLRGEGLDESLKQVDVKLLPQKEGQYLLRRRRRLRRRAPRPFVFGPGQPPLGL